MRFALKLDAFLAIVAALSYEVFVLLGYALPLLPFAVTAGLVILVAHLVLTFKILRPLHHFVNLADAIADGEVPANPDMGKLDALGDVSTSFGKIFCSLVESREAIEHYMKTISEMNRELEGKVDSLSVLYAAGKAMGASLSVDTLIRTLLSLITERLQVTGAAIMLYSDRTDMVTIKDLLGFSPELFARFRFYSDNKIVANIFAEEGFWKLDEKATELLVAEFETDACRALHLMFPMRLKDHFVGLILLGGRKDQTPFAGSDIQVIQALASLAATSINNASLYEKSETTKNELDRKVFNLMSLQQSGKVLSSTLNLDELIKISIDMFLETVWANKGVLMLIGEERPVLEVKAVKGIEAETVKNLEKDAAEVWAMTTLQKEKRPILAQELASNTTYQSYTAIGRPLPFAVYVPLLKEGELYGVVKVGPKINGEPFTENDLEFFSTLASQAVIAFENARLYSLAITDSITKLFVHRYFQLRLDEEVKRSRRYNSTLSLLMCDIDHFKDINDKYGHQQGDIILREISLILRKNIRTTDIAARYGGEEFVIILPETTQSDARIVAERIRRDISKFEFPSIAQGQAPLHCTISIGVAGFPLNANDKDELIQRADSSMYQAKGAGRNRVILCGVDQ
ncbi:MAG: diguanylate cyclase [Candidatus Riflebacteria bacterium]|nr:diguanylate cyclase [Candidatus Riflebacteria bacterium]